MGYHGNTVLALRPGSLVLILFALLISHTHGQELRIEPPNWWVDMKNPEVQLLVHFPNVQEYQVTLEDEQVVLSRVHKADSPNYLFLDLHIPSGSSPRTLNIKFKAPDGAAMIRQFPLLSRKSKGEDLLGFDSSDVIYLVTPDRFVNADPTNDSFEELRQTGIDRSDDYARHGGDIAGMSKHLDYLIEMGFTALWSSPLLINDMPEQSYHGYAITDYYRVDPRFGTLEEYKELSNKAHEKGIKLIMDQVANHCGLEHWWMQDLPFSDWVNDQANFEAGKNVLQTNHRRTSNQDIYASIADREVMRQGWFVSAMPDLNQKNPFMARYIIQNSIWWIETLQLGGIRQDTYPYPDKDFMAQWAREIMEEYPNFNIVGEEWSYNPLLVAYWQDGSGNSDGYRSFLKSTMDFPLQSALIQAIREGEQWNTGWIKLYEALANDFAYVDPALIMLFTDNHDMDRVFTQLGEDVTGTKMALAFTLTAPRIPQVYYGTEVLISNSEKPGSHGRIRTDFPGGWTSDTSNAFTGDGLTAQQKDMQDWLKAVLHFRKDNAAIHSGRTVHFSPKDGVYVLFRITDGEKFMLILNKNQEPYVLDLNRYKELYISGGQAMDVITGERFIVKDELELTSPGPTLLSIKSRSDE